MKPSSFASAFNSSMAGSLPTPLISVTRLVVSAAGSAQMQRSEPSSSDPEGSKAGSFKGMPSSSANTVGLRIARQSVGIGTPAASGSLDGFGSGVDEASGEGDAEAAPSGAGELPHPLSIRASNSAVPATAARVFMPTKYRLSPAQPCRRSGVVVKNGRMTSRSRA